MALEGNVSTTYRYEDIVLSKDAETIYTWAVFSVLCQKISLFGVVTNIINIICLAKQGLDDSVNISLIGLSFSDLGSLVTSSGICILVTPALMEADLPFEPLDITYLTLAMPHFTFTRVSSCITAMITLERCLCITAPLKIKNLFTPKRTTTINICMYLILFCGSVPVYLVNKLDMKFSSIRNKTLIGIISTKDKENVEMISFAINNFSIPFGAFVIIVVCTSILSFQLRIKSKWRLKATSGSQTGRVSNRNQKAAKMVVMISVVFIVCFIPMNITMLAIGLLPELSINGKYTNISRIISGIGYIMESLNSSMNIFIYYFMSSKYKESFNKFIWMCKSTQTTQFDKNVTSRF